MKRKLSLVILFISAVIFFSCNDTSNDSHKSITNDQSPEKKLPIYLIDSLEHFFGNENWQMIDGVDTSYLLFSRQNDRYIKVYHYKMSQGDSVNNTISEISFKGDSVVWTKPGQQLILQKAKDNEIAWKNNYLQDTTPGSYRSAGKNKIIFQRATKKIYLAKTITLSDFLVRSRYDFLHGTHYAFDTIKFDLHRSKKIPGKAVIRNTN